MSTDVLRRIFSQYKPQKGLKLTSNNFVVRMSLLMALCYDIWMTKCGSRKDAEPALQGSTQQESRDVRRPPIFGTHNGDQTFPLMCQSISLKALTRRLSRLFARGSHWNYRMQHWCNGGFQGSDAALENLDNFQWALRSDNFTPRTSPNRQNGFDVEKVQHSIARNVIAKSVNPVFWYSLNGVYLIHNQSSRAII